MTAQQFAKVWEATNPGRRADWNWDEFAEALSAHNTAEAKEKELAVQTEYAKKAFYEMSAILDLAGTGDIYKLTNRLNSFKDELLRLRSQGAGPWMRDAAFEVARHVEVYGRFKDAEMVEIIRKHAPVEGPWEAVSEHPPKEGTIAFVVIGGVVQRASAVFCGAEGWEWIGNDWADNAPASVVTHYSPVPKFVAGPSSHPADWGKCQKCHQKISKSALLHVCSAASPPEGKP